MLFKGLIAWLHDSDEQAIYKLGKMFLEVGHPSKWPPSTFETYKVCQSSTAIWLAPGKRDLCPT